MQEKSASPKADGQPVCALTDDSAFRKLNGKETSDESKSRVEDKRSGSKADDANRTVDKIKSEAAGDPTGLQAPMQFNKDYSLSPYHNAAYSKLLSLRLAKRFRANTNQTSSSKRADANSQSNERSKSKSLFDLNKQANNETDKRSNNPFYRSGGAIAGRTFAQLAQFKAAKMALIGQVLGLNGFGVRNEQTAATCTATNSEVFTTSASHMLSLLCMTTVCSPSGPVDLVNGMEFGQCTMSCMSNPKIPLALYVYKNYGNLNENLKFKSDFTSKLPSLLTTNTVIEGIDTLRLSSSGLGSEQIGELTNFKNTLLSKTAK